MRQLRTDPVLESLAAKEREDDAQDKRDEFMQRKADDEIRMVRQGFGPDVLDSDEIVENAMERDRDKTGLQLALARFVDSGMTDWLREYLGDVVEDITERKDWQDKVDRKGECL